MLTENAHQKGIVQERMTTLFTHIMANLAANSGLALLFAFVNREILSKTTLSIWLSSLALTMLYRFYIYRRWHAQRENMSEVLAKKYLTQYRIGVCITAIIWGLGGVIIPSEHQEHMLFTTFTLGGLSAGGSIALAVDRTSIIAFLMPILLPQVASLLLANTAISISMSIMIMIYLAFLINSARVAGLQFETNYYLRKHAVDSETQLLELLKSSPIATRIQDLESLQVVFANSQYARLIETTEDNVIGQVPNHYYANSTIYQNILEKLQHGERIDHQLVELTNPDTPKWTKWTLASYSLIQYQNKPAVLGWFYDITDRKLMEERVSHMAFHDPLTDLPNRLLITERLKQAMSNAAFDNKTIGLMFVDLDAFKPVNDTYGHAVGDLLLKAVSDRILDCLRSSDSLGRIGGDEFIILLPAVRTEENARQIAEKIRTALQEPFTVQQHHLSISCSIGIALFPVHAQSSDALLRNADIAMYHAKNRGGNQITVYDPAIDQKESKSY